MTMYKLLGGAGDAWMGRPGLSATVRVLRIAFFRKVVTRHDTGLGEAYMDGDYEVNRPCCAAVCIPDLDMRCLFWQHDGHEFTI